jgi:hypothetical protein
MQSATKVPLMALVGVSMIVAGLTLSLTATVLLNGGPAAEGLRMKGKVDIVLYDESGAIKDERHLDNLIVNTGVEGVASRIAPHDGTVNPATPYNYIALGTSNTAADPAQTALVSELPSGPGYSRVQDAVAQYSTISGNKLILSVTFLPGQGTGTLRESGIFNASTGGDMLARQTFADISKAAGDTLTVTWTITLTPS